MLIVGSSLTLSAERSYARTEFTHERLQIDRRGPAGSDDRVATGNGFDHASISARAYARALQPPIEASALANDPATAEAIAAAQDQADDDPNVQVLLRLIERLTGESVRLFDPRRLERPSDGADGRPRDTPAPPRDGVARDVAVDYQRHHVIDETESTRFRAEGVVQTADGQEIRFSIDLQLSRSFHQETSERVQIGEPPKRQDPLVINFGGSAAQLVDQRFAFDLDSDGDTESLASLASGSGFLSFDRNGNGRIDNGSELFGASSGDGYADLAQLDSDGNGWLDAGDAKFDQLRVWVPGADGDGTLRRLEDVGVAAISVANIATQFALRGEGNSDLGQIRATGVYLGTANNVGTTQQIDLSV